MQQLTQAIDSGVNPQEEIEFFNNHLDTILEAYARLAKAWGIKPAVAAQLIDSEPKTYRRLITGTGKPRLKKDQLLRLSGLIGLYKGLHLYYSDELADQWCSLPNKGLLFQGATPIQFMISQGLPGILAVRRYIDALRGGL